MTVISAGGADSEGGTSESVSPVLRHRGQPFASIPEDHALDDHAPQQQNIFQQQNVPNSRCASPAPSWDFSLDESSDSVSNIFHFKNKHIMLHHIYYSVNSYKKNTLYQWMAMEIIFLFFNNC